MYSVTCIYLSRALLPSHAVGAKQEQIEEDHGDQLEEDDKDEAVSGCRFVCLMQLPSCPKERIAEGLAGCGPCL